MARWFTPDEAKLAITAAYCQALAGTMEDLMLTNPKLSVQALGFDYFGGELAGVLITPWCMNLMLLPGLQSQWAQLPPGRQFQHDFPYGSFIFTVARLPGLDVFAQCSLFSDMAGFGSQEDVVAAGEAALDALLSKPVPASVSRRHLLQGRLR